MATPTLIEGSPEPQIVINPSTKVVGTEGISKDFHLIHSN